MRHSSDSDSRVQHKDSSRRMQEQDTRHRLLPKTFWMIVQSINTSTRLVMQDTPCKRQQLIHLIKLLQMFLILMKKWCYGKYLSNSLKN